MKRILLLILTSIVTVSLLATEACAVNSNPVMRIGLYYGTSALPSANLANEVGSGYTLGYYNSSKEFSGLYSISNENITVMKDDNMYLGSDNAYYDVLTSSSTATIGAYHVEVNKSFASGTEAATYAKNITSAGYAAFPAYVSGHYVVRAGSYTSQSKAEEARTGVSKAASGMSTKTVGGSGTCYTVTVTKSSQIIFEYDSGGTTGLAIVPKSTGQASKTWFKGYQYYGGFSYLRSGGDVTVINYVLLDDYVKGVIPYEMSPSWPVEALKAQAICARGYAYSNIGKHAKYGFDLCTSTDCQVYHGANAATTSSDSAVTGTSGQFVTYEGKAINAFFFSSDGGSTENSENVWGGYVAYLRAVTDPYEDLDHIKNGRWSTTVSNETVASILKDKGYAITGVSDLYIDEFTTAGNVYRLTAVDTSGNKLNFEKQQARTILNSTKYGVAVNSIRYKIGGSASTSPPATPDGIYINDSSVDGAQSVHVIGGDGTIQTLNTLIGQTVITGNGKTTLSSQASSADGSATVSGNNGTYTINGTGWGHNVGMSQYGAKGMAEKGFSFDQILKFYYTNVSISSIN